MASSSHIHFFNFFKRSVSLHRTSPQTSPRRQFAKVFSSSLQMSVPKTKNPLGASGLNFSPLCNYRIAPRLLDGWVPKSKPIRIGAAIHGHSVFRLSLGDNQYFLDPTIHETLPAWLEFAYGKVLIQHDGDLVEREPTILTASASANTSLAIRPAFDSFQ